MHSLCLCNPWGAWGWFAVRCYLSVCWVRRAPTGNHPVRQPVPGLPVERMRTEWITLRTEAGRTLGKDVIRWNPKGRLSPPLTSQAGLVAKGNFTNFAQAAQSLSIWCEKERGLSVLQKAHRSPETQARLPCSLTVFNSITCPRHPNCLLYKAGWEESDGWCFCKSQKVYILH